MARVSFREQVLRVREEAIVASVNRLLAEKGYDGMTVDAVAADVGIAKASLYKHFASKEALAAAAMIRVLDRALAFVAEHAADGSASPLERLRAAVRWAMQQQLAGEMPALPPQNSALHAVLSTNRACLDRLVALGDGLCAWITAAREQGQLGRHLPVEVMLYTLYARACDPVLSLLKASGQHSDAQIVEWVLASCFDGLRGAGGPAQRADEAPAVDAGAPAAQTSMVRIAS